MFGVFHLFFMSSNLFSTNRKKGYEDLTEIQMLLEFRTGISICIFALSLSVSKCLVHYFTYKKSVEPSFSKKKKNHLDYK